MLLPAKSAANEPCSPHHCGLPHCILRASRSRCASKQARYRGPKAPDVLPAELPTPGSLPPSDAPMLFTGDDPEAARRLMEAMWARAVPITDAVCCCCSCTPAQGTWVLHSPCTDRQGLSLRASASRQPHAAPLPSCQVLAAYLSAQEGGNPVPTSTENQTIASEVEFVEVRLANVYVASG